MVEPGQEGVAHLNQRGTLVEGTYSLSGGFSGSFRGTFVAGKVRLERIDSQYGFAAIYYGPARLRSAERLVLAERRLQLSPLDEVGTDGVQPTRPPALREQVVGVSCWPVTMPMDRGGAGFRPTGRPARNWPGG